MTQSSALLSTASELRAHYRAISERLRGPPPRRPVYRTAGELPHGSPEACQTLTVWQAPLGRHSTDDRILMAAREIRGSNVKTIGHIQAIVAQAFGISVADLVGHCRIRRYTVPRFVAIVLCQRFLDNSLVRLAQRFNRSDHTVILNAMQRMASVVDNVLASERFQQSR